MKLQISHTGLGVMLGTFLLVATLTMAAAFSFGKIVFDPTNFTKNVIQAREAITQTLTLLRQARQLTSGGYYFGNLGGETAKFSELIRELTRMYGDLRYLEKESKQMFREWGASGLSWEGYLDREVKIAKYQYGSREAALRTVGDSIKQVEANYTRIQGLQTQIPASVGTHQAMQNLNQYMDITVRQQQHLLMMLATHYKADDMEKVETSAERVREAETIKKMKAEQKRVNKEAIQAFGG